MLPAMAVLCVFTLYPIGRLFVNAFQEYGRAQLMGAPPKWIGFANFVRAITQSNLLMVTLRTFVFMVAAVLCTVVLGTLIAILMTKLNRFFRMLTSIGLLLAWAMPALTATIVWGWMIDTNFGVINYLLTKVTGHNWIGHQWLLNPVSFFFVLGIVIVWQGIPFISFTIYAAITGVPPELTEAAAIDQAGPVKRFFLIQFPYVRSVFVVVIVLSIIWDMNVFTQVIPLQALGGVSDSTSTLGVWIYQQGNSNVGMSAAAGIFMLILMLIISVFYVRQTLREGE